jgi:hypothetical protein
MQHIKHRVLRDFYATVHISDYITYNDWWTVKKLKGSGLVKIEEVQWIFLWISEKI